MGHILHRVVDVKSSLFRLSKIVGKHSIYWCTPLCSSSSPSPDNISGQWDNLQFSMNSMVFFQNSGSFPLVIPYSFVNLSAHHHSIHIKTPMKGLLLSVPMRNTSLPTKAMPSPKLRPTANGSSKRPMASSTSTTAPPVPHTNMAMTLPPTWWVSATA